MSTEHRRSPWDQVPRPDRPKSPARVPFAGLRDRLGISPDAIPEPIVIDGPIIADCPSSDVVCEGMLRLVEQDDPIWVARCDRCGYETGIPARRLDPEIALTARLERAELPERFVGQRFEQDSENQPALDAIRAWLADADPDPKRKVASLLPAPALWSDNGVGKSHLMVAVCTRLIRELELSVLFRSAGQLLRALQRFDDPVVRERAWRLATTVDVLALDDLGAPRNTDFRDDELAELIDERYVHERPILIATNYPPDAWEMAMDERTRSRLRGMTFPVELAGPDRRQHQISPSQPQESAV